MNDFNNSQLNIECYNGCYQSYLIANTTNLNVFITYNKNGCHNLDISLFHSLTVTINCVDDNSCQDLIFNDMKNITNITIKCMSSNSVGVIYGI